MEYIFFKGLIIYVRNEDLMNCDLWDCDAVYSFLP
jgi:hypothetical protein